MTVTDDGSFTCSGTFEGAGFEFTSRLTFELDGDLISHLVHHGELTDQQMLSSRTARHGFAYACAGFGARYRGVT